ncbi:MAG TPA: phosphomannomutase/phosphoglucomutase [Acidimicrobiales bacterium]|nr:phosphomannomutase/phosphoglucomutase [Acidimicrobiales bacterium]
MPAFDQVFKAYDIRGIVPDQLDASMCRAIGAAFAVFARESDPGVDRILLARDMRPSGLDLSHAFAEGAMAQGVDVTYLGLTSTDMLYYASGKLDAPGAVFTASHNPAQYNGMKLCLAGAKPIGEDSGLLRIKELAADGQLRDVDGHERGRGTSLDLLEDFADHVRSFIDVRALRPLRVVADTANGMGGMVVPAVFRVLPLQLEILFEDLDGTFPNHPADPIQPENLKDLMARVLDTGADIGLAFDGDADRVFLVDEQARPVSGSLTTALVATSVLDKYPGSTIIHNLICSKTVPETVREHGGTPLRTRVGHSFIKQVMAETGAAFGGEHSGHYYFRDNFRADSGLIAALIVLEAMSREGKALSELLRPLDRYAASGEINFRVSDAAAVIEHVSSAFEANEQDRLDGLTVDCGDWWFNLRPSNTEPLLRLNLEAANPESRDAHVAELRQLINPS